MGKTWKNYMPLDIHWEEQDQVDKIEGLDGYLNSIEDYEGHGAFRTRRYLGDIVCIEKKQLAVYIVHTVTRNCKPSFIKRRCYVELFREGQTETKECGETFGQIYDLYVQENNIEVILAGDNIRQPFSFVE